MSDFKMQILYILLFLANGLSGKSVTQDSDAVETATMLELKSSDTNMEDTNKQVANSEKSLNFSETSPGTSAGWTTESSDDEKYEQSTARATMIDRYNLTIQEGQDYEEIDMEPSLRQHFAKQIGLPNNPIGMLVSRVPCHCQSGVCGCCTGFLLSAFRSKGCMNLTYIPEDFAFEVKMMMNDAVLYKNKLSGRNPRPICVNPPRFNFIELCANFYDIYFVGRNMHVCLEMNANFQGYELFNRSFDCMRLGDQGVKIVKPEDGGGLPHKPSGGVDADVDDSGDDIEDYDENLLRDLL